VYVILVGRYTPDLMQFYEAWFYLGAALFAASLWRFRHVPATSAAAPTPS
jgi:hypothetical protein